MYVWKDVRMCCLRLDVLCMALRFREVDDTAVSLDLSYHVCCKGYTTVALSCVVGVFFFESLLSSSIVRLCVISSSCI